MPGTSGSATPAPISKWEIFKSTSTIMMWIVGLVFGAGILYNKLNIIEQSDKGQDNIVSQMKDAQVRAADGIDRLEKSQKELSKNVVGWLERMSDKQSAMDKRILRNEIEIENLKKESHQKGK